MRKRKISRTLVFAYSVLIVFIIGVASVFFYEYNKQSIYSDAVIDLSQTTEAVMSQVDARFANMEQTIVDAVTAPDFVDHWKSYTQSGNERAGYLVKRALIDAYMYKSDIRRVAVFNAEGVNICTGDNTVTREEVVERVEKLQARYNLDKNSSRVLMGEHTDFWYSESDINVISEIKPIKDREGNTLGYIEVQQNIFYLKNICDVNWGSTNLSMFIFFGDTDEILYEYLNKYNSENSVEDFQTLTQQFVKVRDTGKNVVATASSRYYECRTVVVLPYEILFRSMKNTVMGIALVAMLLVIFTIFYIEIATKAIMRPVINLVKRMEETDWENLNIRSKKKHTNWETEIIENSFDEMADRLNQAVEKQQKLTDVQNRTLFNALQSEIGPHFLYNSLGSIANMCERGENEEAADACYSLTEILRYAANYADIEVWLSEEVANARAYLSIMKSRYRQRLYYCIETEGNMNGLTIPKLTIQPLIENAIRYALLEEEEVRIFVKVVEKDSHVSISVTDNGCGFTEEKKQMIRDRVAELKEKSGGEIIEKIKFGGMGLSGTILRLSIFFGETFSWTIMDNCEEPGTTILLEIDLKK